ncbi:unnamed protein product [Gordionus sp. m RMFG-2023]|uniref:tumor necrosis factor alpha-induced protein 8-like protein n=1 Tax=Gordionus sp. m RMFG-2023 TaxID=3053472 RepID=UPI0030DDDECC
MTSAELMDDNIKFDSKTLALSLQKRILTKMMSSNKRVIKMFIDDKGAHLLDAFYSICKSALNSKKEAETLIKRIIKTSIKVGILAKNDVFDEKELETGYKFQSIFKTFVLTLVSFSEVEYSYDRDYLITLLIETKSLLKSLVKCHLTPKSLERIDSIYKLFMDPVFLDNIFVDKSKCEVDNTLVITGDRYINNDDILHDDITIRQNIDSRLITFNNSPKTKKFIQALKCVVDDF